MLKRLAYPNRLEDMKVFFRRSLSALSEISNFVCVFIKELFNPLLEDLESHLWLNEEKFQQYANVSECFVDTFCLGLASFFCITL